MVNEEFVAAKDLIMSKEKILLLTHHKLDADGLSSMLAMGIILSRLGKDIKILSTDKIPDTFEFLPHINKVTVSDDASRDFVISIKKTNGLEIDKLRYNTDDKYLNIVISPKKGDISEENIAYSRGVGEYDLIIIVDTGDLDHLGNIYKDNVDLFYNTPIVNIDHHVTNTGFGQVNLVDSTASSSTVIVYELIKHFSNNWKEIIDEDIATLLMTGLITDTGSFRHNNTTPKALEIAADLMEFGARQQDIIKNIYKTKHLSTLQMWGKVLSKIKEDPIHRLVWSTVTVADLKETGADVDDSEGIIDELLGNAPGAEIICLFKDSFDGVMSVSLRTSSITINGSLIAKHYGGGGHRQASGFKISGVKNFDLEVAKVIKYIQGFQQDRLGIAANELDRLEDSNDNKIELKADTKQESQQGELTETGVEFPKSASQIKSSLAGKSEGIKGVFGVESKGSENKKDENLESKTDNDLNDKVDENTDIINGDGSVKVEDNHDEKKVRLEPDSTLKDSTISDKTMTNNVSPNKFSNKVKSKKQDYIKAEDGGLNFAQAVKELKARKDKKDKDLKNAKQINGDKSLVQETVSEQQLETKLAKDNSEEIIVEEKTKLEDSKQNDIKAEAKSGEAVEEPVLKTDDNADNKDDDVKDITKQEDDNKIEKENVSNQKEANIQINTENSTQAKIETENDKFENITQQKIDKPDSDQVFPGSEVSSNVVPLQPKPSKPVSNDKPGDLNKDQGSDQVVGADQIMDNKQEQAAHANQVANSKQNITSVPAQSSQIDNAQVGQLPNTSNPNVTSKIIQDDDGVKVTENVNINENTPDQNAMQNQSSSLSQQPQSSQQANQQTGNSQQTQANPAAQSGAGLVSKDEADRYARRFYELLQTSKTGTEEYKKYYEGYVYYAKLAGWQV